MNPTGGTDFNEPLINAAKILNSCVDDFESFVVVMMSDGLANYPKKGVEFLKQSPALDKMKFKSICYGEEKENIDRILKPLADEFGGETLRVLEPSQLTDAFI